MPHIHRSALLPFSDSQMFALVNDIRAYPQYMDGCVGADVHEASLSQMRATLFLEKHGVAMQFTTNNQLDAPKSIIMTLEQGPFAEFSGQWFFQSLRADACKVILDLQFTLANPISGFVVGKLFDGIANHMVDSVVMRAKAIYGKTP